MTVKLEVNLLTTINEVRLYEYSGWPTAPAIYKQRARVTEVRKEDLDRMAMDIKEHIDERLLPMQEELDEHELILRGKNKMNGLIGEVRDINTGGRLIKWLAGIGGLSGIGAWIAQWWRDLGD